MLVKLLPEILGVIKQSTLASNPEILNLGYMHPQEVHEVFS